MCGFVLVSAAVSAFLLPLASVPQQSPASGGSSAVSQAAADDTKFFPVNIRTLQDVSSANAKLGQPVWMEAVDPVVVDGRTLIAAGARVRAAVSAVRHRGHNRREGTVAITIQSIVATDGTEWAVRTATLRQGSGRGEPVFGPCTFPIPADPAGLFRKGQDVVIPKGYVITVALPKPA